MRIGIMCHSSCGGSVRIATQLAAEMAQRDHRTHLFCRTSPQINWDHSSTVILHRSVLGKDDQHHHPATLYTDWTKDELQSYLSILFKVITEEGLDLLHFHYAVPFAEIAAEIQRQLGRDAPLIVGTLHGSDVSVFGLDPVKGPPMAKALRNMDGLTTVSSNHARRAKEILGLPAYPEIIPNFVNLSKFKPRDNGESGEDRKIENQRKWNGIGSQKAIIVHVSNFRPIKGIQNVARIFLGIRKKINAELWLIGDGQEMEATKAIFKGYGVENEVRYCGLKRNIVPLLAQTDLMIVASRSESFCLAALEAMACGIPVLATRVGGLPEVVIDGKTGFLYRIGDESKAVKIAVKLLTDPIRHGAMKKAAYNHAQNFGQEQTVSLYEDFYDRLLQNQRPSRSMARRVSYR